MSTESNALFAAIVHLEVAGQELSIAHAHAPNGLEYVPLLTALRETLVLAKERQKKVEATKP